MAAVRHLGFLNAILNVLRCKECQCVSPCQISSKAINGCGDIAILRFSKTAAAAILDFQKFKFLTAGTFGRPNLRKPAKFYHDRPIRCRGMAKFRFFRMAAVHHLKFAVGYLDRPRRVLGGLYHCAKMAGIDAPVSIICRLGMKTPIHAPKLGFCRLFTT